MSFFLADGVWSRAEDRDPETARYAFKSEEELKTTLRNEATRPECQRHDWIEDTRERNAAKK